MDGPHSAACPVYIMVKKWKLSQWTSDSSQRKDDFNSMPRAFLERKWKEWALSKHNVNQYT